jgi:hypothetical protein
MTSTSEFSSGSGRNLVSIEEAFGTIRSGLNRLDAERALAYSDLATFRTAKSQLLARHEKLLALKLGPDDPRVSDVSAQRAVIGGQIADLRLAQAVASVPAPEPEPAGYVLHGFVRDAGFDPVSGAVVAFYNADGSRREDFKPVTTNPQGYFELSTTQLASASETQLQAKAPSLSVPLELRIFDTNRTPLQTSLQSIEAIPGVADFRWVVVVDSSGPPATPPDKVPTSPSQPSASPTVGDPSGKLRTMAAELRKGPSLQATQSKGTTAQGKRPTETTPGKQVRPKPPTRKRTPKK